MAKDLPAKRIYGLIGYPVKHSFSPAMHNRALEALNINAEYRLFEVKPEELEGFLLKNIAVQDTKGESFFSQDISGFNITIPHKIKAREILENKFPYNKNDVQMQQDLYYVRLSGAINTVKRDEDRLGFRNTDAAGFLRSLTQKGYLCLNFDPKGKTIFVIGCGGAGRAIIASLTWKNIGVRKIYINDINNEAVDSTKKYFQQLPQYSYLEDKLEFISVGQIKEKIRESDLLINTSPVGLKENNDSPLNKEFLHDNLSVYDGVYHRETQLIKDAKSKGLVAMGGLGMLLYQGVAAFEFWTGKEAPVEIMRKALTEAMNK